MTQNWENSAGSILRVIWSSSGKIMPRQHQSVEPKVRLQGYGYNPFCSHSSRCLAVLVWQYFEEAFCAPKVRLKWYSFKGFPSHSSHCSGGLFHSTPGPAQSGLITSHVRHEEKSTNPHFSVRIFSGGLGVFHVKGWGPKSSVCSLKPGKSNFFAGISRDFARKSQRPPKSLRKKVCVQVSAPNMTSWAFQTSPCCDPLWPNLRFDVAESFSHSGDRCWLPNNRCGTPSAILHSSQKRLHT